MFHDIPASVEHYRIAGRHGDERQQQRLAERLAALHPGAHPRRALQPEVPRCRRHDITAARRGRLCSLNLFVTSARCVCMKTASAGRTARPPAHHHFRGPPPAPMQCQRTSVLMNHQVLSRGALSPEVARCWCHCGPSVAVAHLDHCVRAGRRISTATKHADSHGVGIKPAVPARGWPKNWANVIRSCPLKLLKIGLRMAVICSPRGSLPSSCGSAPKAHDRPTQECVGLASKF